MVVPESEEPVAKELVDVPAVRLDDLLALRQPLAGNQGRVSAGTRPSAWWN
jgi:hypothetical protein